MRETFKSDGKYDPSKVGMGFAVAVVLILQQWQTYRIAEIEANGQVRHLNYLSKKEVEECKKLLLGRLEFIEKKLNIKGEGNGF